MNPNAAAFALILKQRETQSADPSGSYNHGQTSWANPPHRQHQHYQQQQSYYPTVAPVPPASNFHQVGLSQSHYGYAPQMQQPQMYQQAALPTYQQMQTPSAYYSALPQMSLPQPYQPVAPIYSQYHQYPMGYAVPHVAPPQYPPAASAVQPFQQQLNAYSNKSNNAYNNKKSNGYGGGAKSIYKPYNAPQVAPPAPAEAQWYCEPCDKEFTQLIAYEAHIATHESCKHPGCSFSATKKVVIAHFHGVHGQFSGSGYKVIEVEGQKFRVLMGQSPEEIAQWRAERRKKFPSAESADAKKAELNELIAAGGIDPKVGKFGNKTSTVGKKRALDGEARAGSSTKVQKVRKVDDDGEATADGNGDDLAGGEEGDVRSVEGEEGAKRRCYQYGRGRCKNGDSCAYSHAFEPQVCQFFLRGICRLGFKCFNIHNNKARLANKEARLALRNSSKTWGGSADGDAGDKGADGVNGAENEDGADISGRKTAESERKSANKDANKKNRADNKAKEKSKEKEKPLKRGELYLPPPLAGGERGTLWKKLLEDEIAREENVVLQCLRFLVQQNFLEETAPEEP